MDAPGLKGLTGSGHTVDQSLRGHRNGHSTREKGVILEVREEPMCLCLGLKIEGQANPEDKTSAENKAFRIKPMPYIDIAGLFIWVTEGQLVEGSHARNLVSALQVTHHSPHLNDSSEKKIIPGNGCPRIKRF
ncbi:hypothetical protein CEXT_85921 [Caerostris extrusa]|uniref:Uncharacterized protein n=1 Tax=Caerostris extrusa TaxID=172846 RepID=A0AAV4Y2D6_CAEEX|nr:hypothetical protein CEXT_85921 [Caerostris extrusa]